MNSYFLSLSFCFYPTSIHNSIQNLHAYYIMGVVYIGRDYFFSIIPALVMLVLVLLTRKILLSLGTGIIIGALFIHNFHVLPAIQEIFHVFIIIFFMQMEVFK